MLNNQHAKTKDWQLNIAVRNALNGEITEGSIISIEMCRNYRKERVKKSCIFATENIKFNSVASV